MKVLPNLTSRVRSRVEDLQRKLAERDESRHGSVIGRAENTATSKLDVKVGHYFVYRNCSKVLDIIKNCCSLSKIPPEILPLVCY